MKNLLKQGEQLMTAARIITTLVTALILAGCAQVTEDLPKAGAAADGRTVVRITGNDARTLMPTMIGAAQVSKYEVSITKGEETVTWAADDAAKKAELTGGGHAFDLADGTWTVTIDAYRLYDLDGAGGNPAAEYKAASGSASLTVTASGANTVSVTLNEIAIADWGIQKGIFSWNFTLPEGVTATMAKLGAIDLTGTSGSIEADAGIYDFTLILAQTATGLTTGMYETAYIFPGLETPAVFDFTPTTPTLSWSTYSGSAWTQTAANKYTSNNKSDNSASWLRLSISAPMNSTVTVKMTASSESNYDWGYMSGLDGSALTSGYLYRVSGTTSQSYSYSVPAGNHNHYIYFGYVKDGSVNNGNDSVTVEVISIQGGAAGFTFGNNIPVSGTLAELILAGVSPAGSDFTITAYSDAACTTAISIAPATVGADWTWTLWVPALPSQTVYFKAASSVWSFASGGVSEAVTLGPEVKTGVAVSAPMIYGINIDVTGTHTFTAATVGYGTQTAESVTITNMGNQATGALTAGLTGTNAASFTLSTTSISSIAVDGTGSFTVVPNNGLAAGTYTATVTVSGGNGITANFTVSFRVNLYSISLNQTGTYTFPAVSAGYAGQSVKSVTISNTGNQATGVLTAALSGTNSTSFTLSTTAPSSIAVSGTGSFTVVPNTGLVAGTYTATVTVSGGNGITDQSFDVSFTVNPVGTAKVIYAWVNAHEIEISANTATLSRGANQSLTITMTGSGYSNYQWTAYGTDVPGAAGTAASYTFNSAGQGNGKYYIGLRVYKDYIWYSTQITITVQD